MSAHGSAAEPDEPGVQSEEQGRSAEQGTASALWVPLVALGLLAAAIWFGSTPLRHPPAQPAQVAAPVAPSAVTTVDPLPSWNEGATKKAILDFVASVTRAGAETFVPAPERIAVFDFDGTLVCEKPLFHGLFLLDRIRGLADRRPEIADEEPYASLLAGDADTLRRLGRKFVAELTFATLAGQPVERLEAEAREFFRTARHPVFDVPLRDTAYQPMRELIALLESRGFTVWVCSGSGVNFLRPVAGELHGIGPERVIGSRPRVALEAVGDGSRELVVQPEVQVLNDGPQKPVSIAERVGRRPILVAGNVGNAGDIEMLRWSQAGQRPSLQLLVHHDDADREMAYDEPRDESLRAAERHGWQVVRMKTDWNRVFPLPLAKTGSAAAVAAAPPVAAGVTRAAPAAVEPPVAPAAEVAPPTKWAEELAALAARDREAAPRPGGICLLGSSNISKWQSLAEDFPGLDVANRGVSGCRLGELTAHVAGLIEPVRPRVVVVAAGTNDVADGASPEDVQAAFGRLVEEIGRVCPEAKIVFLGISPTIRRWEQWPRQQEANAAVRGWIAEAMADESGPAAKRKLVYLDTSGEFLGQDGRPAAECFLADGQHPSTIGNARRAAIMRPLLAALLAE